MRSDQFMGLSRRGLQLVDGLQPMKVGFFEGAFGNLFDITAYFRGGVEVYREFIQVQPWSSGPVFFIALQRPDGEVVEGSLWSDVEIAEFGGGEVAPVVPVVKLGAGESTDVHFEGVPGQNGVQVRVGGRVVFQVLGDFITTHFEDFSGKSQGGKG